MLRIDKYLSLAILAFFVVQTVTPPVVAQDFSSSTRKNIAIVGFGHGVHKEQEDQVYKNVRQTLQSMDAYQVLDSSAVKLGISKNSSRKSLVSTKRIEKAYEHFAQGVEFYRNLDLTQAIRELNRSVKEYRAGIASIEDNHYLLYAHLYLGMALYFDGRTKEGEKFIREMIQLDAKRKTRVLPSRDFPPKIVEIHRKQTEMVEKVSTGIMKVDSGPSAARVILDGMDVGETPVTIHDVPLGQHFIAIDQAGHEIYKQLVDVKAGEQNIIATLTPQKLFMAKNQFEQEKDAQQTKMLSKIAKELSVDYFILGQVEPLEKNFEMKLQSYDVLSGKYSSVYAKDLGSKQRKVDGKITKLTKDWVESIKKPGVPMAGAVDFQKDFSEPTFDDKPKKKKKGSKKLLWIGLGVVALGAGSYLIFAGGSDPTSNVLNVPNPLN